MSTHISRRTSSTSRRGIASTNCLLELELLLVVDYVLEMLFQVVLLDFRIPLAQPA